MDVATDDNRGRGLGRDGRALLRDDDALVREAATIHGCRVVVVPVVVRDPVVGSCSRRRVRRRVVAGVALVDRDRARGERGAGAGVVVEQAEGDRAGRAEATGQGRGVMDVATDDNRGRGLGRDGRRVRLDGDNFKAARAGGLVVVCVSAVVGLPVEVAGHVELDVGRGTGHAVDDRDGAAVGDLGRALRVAEDLVMDGAAGIRRRTRQG